MHPEGAVHDGSPRLPAMTDLAAPGAFSLAP